MCLTRKIFSLSYPKFYKTFITDLAKTRPIWSVADDGPWNSNSGQKSKLEIKTKLICNCKLKLKTFSLHSASDVSNIALFQYISGICITISIIGSGCQLHVHMVPSVPPPPKGVINILRHYQLFPTVIQHSTTMIRIFRLFDIFLLSYYVVMCPRVTFQVVKCIL